MEDSTLMVVSFTFQGMKRKENNTPVSKSRREDEPVGLKLITVFRDATKVLCLY